MNKKAQRKVPKEISISDIKIRKSHAPGVRVILSDKEKKDKHKKDWLKEEEDA